MDVHKDSIMIAVLPRDAKTPPASIDCGMTSRR